MSNIITGHDSVGECAYAAADAQQRARAEFFWEAPSDRCWWSTATPAITAPAEPSGGLVLDHRDVLVRGGDSGPAIDWDNPRASLLLQAIRHEGELQMPQDGVTLSPQVVTDPTRWLIDGAFDPGNRIARKSHSITTT